jgi:hypothetical protein
MDVFPPFFSSSRNVYKFGDRTTRLYLINQPSSRVLDPTQNKNNQRHCHKPVSSTEAKINNATRIKSYTYGLNLWT